MPTRYGTSPWLHLSPPSRVPSFPRYRGGAHTADVVIVGGGLTGCAAAYLCANAGLTTILLERERIGQARTARGAGLLTPQPGPSFRDVTAAHGLRAARRVFDAWRRGALEGAALLRRLRVPCHLERTDIVTAFRRDEEKLLRREYGARREAGLDAVWLTPRQVQGRMRVDAAGALKVGDGCALDPYRACLGLVAAAAGHGAACFEHSAVTTVRFTRRYADVIAEGDKIRTRKVIVATGSATAEFKALQRHFTRREAYVVLTGRMPAAMRRQVGDPRAALTDLHAPPHHVRWSGDDRLIIAGGDQRETPPRQRAAAIVQRTNELMYELLTMYPAIYGLRPDYGWEAPYGETADGLMYIGAHRNFPHHLFALGARPVSVTGAFVAARILLRAVQDAPDPADEVFSWTR